MLNLSTLAKLPVALGAVPVALLVLAGLWIARRLAKLAMLVLAVAAVVGAFLWARGGL